MGETAGWSSELISQCNYANLEKEMGMREGERHNGRKKQSVVSDQTDSEKARDSGQKEKDSSDVLRGGGGREEKEDYQRERRPRLTQSTVVRDTYHSGGLRQTTSSLGAKKHNILTKTGTQCSEILW